MTASENRLLSESTPTHPDDSEPRVPPAFFRYFGASLTHLEGAVFSEDAPDQIYEIELFHDFDGKKVSVGSYSADCTVEKKQSEAEGHHYRIPIPPEWQNRKDLKFFFKIVETGQYFPRKNNRLNFDGSSEQIRKLCFKPRGGSISGGVFHPERKAQIFNVELLDVSETPAKVVSKTPANLISPKRSGIPPGHFFEIPVPDSWKDGNPHPFKLRIEEVDIIFPNEPNTYEFGSDNGSQDETDPTEEAVDKLIEYFKNPLRKSSLNFNIVVVTHEMSLTGAPIIALNLIKFLRRAYKANVTCVSLTHGGTLQKEFTAAAHSLVMPKAGLKPKRRVPDRLPEILEAAGMHTPTVAIVNSLCSSDIAESFANARIPSLFLGHEFPNELTSNPSFQRLSKADGILFPCELVKKAYMAHFEKATNTPEDLGISKLVEDSVVAPQGFFWEEDQTELRNRKRDSAIRSLQRKEWNLSEECFVVLGVGTVGLRKGADWFSQFAINYMAAHPDKDIHFVWVGEETEPRISKFIRMDLEHSGVSDRVHFVGQSSNMTGVYFGADLFLMCSRLDPFPNVVLEAMLHRLPVIGFDNGQGTSVVLEDHGTVTRYLNYCDVSDAISRQMANQEEYQAKAERAALDLIENYSHEIWGKDVFMRLLQVSGKNHPAVQLINAGSLHSFDMLPDSSLEAEKDHGKLLFVRGQMKSGTNWLCNVLNHHPQICVRGEYHWSRKKWDFPESRSSDPFKSLHGRGKEAMKLIAGGKYKYYGDRTPNDMQNPMIDGNSNVIYIRRDPRDIIVSNFFHHLNNPIAGKAIDQRGLRSQLWEQIEKAHQADSKYLSRNPEKLFEDRKILEYLTTLYIGSIREDMRRIEELNRQTETAVFIVSYENMHENFDLELANLFSHLDLRVEDCEKMSDLVKPGFGNRGENSRSFFRSGQAGGWKSYLFRSDARFVWETCEDAFIWGNYETSDQWIDQLPERP